MMLPFKPALCHADTPDHLENYDPAEWTAQVKWDGIRAILAVTAAPPRIYNRSGEEITERFPEFAGIRGSGFFDGEILCFDGTTPRFELVHKRMAQRDSRRARFASRETPATFIAFDFFSGAPLSYRLDALRDKEVSYWRGRDLPIHASPHAAPADMWSAAAQLGLEGIVLKKLDSRYPNGRSRDWVKVKKGRTATFVVTGSTPGEGSRADRFGALELALFDAATGELVPAGKVGSGFSRRDLDAVYLRLQAGEPFLVDVTFQEQLGGKPRFPVYVTTRLDLALTDATTDQLREDRA